MSKRRLYLVTLILLLVAACAPTSGPASPPTGIAIAGTETPAEAPPTSDPAGEGGPPIAPPPAILEVDGKRQTAVTGTYCWEQIQQDGTSVSVCADAFGPVTPAEPLPISSPFTARFVLGVAAVPEELVLRVIPVTQEAGRPVGERRELAWQGIGEGHTLTLGQPSSELSLEPGWYVLDLYARWTHPGNVNYGFLVHVLSGDIPSSGSKPSTRPGERGAALLAFVREGDLWLKRLPDGEETRLTQLGDVVYLPQLSPNGEHVVFHRKGPLVTVMQDPLTQVETMTLWVVPTGSGEPRLLIDPIQGPPEGQGGTTVTYPSEPGTLVWLPGGDEALFATHRLTIEAAPGNYDLWRINVENGQLDALLPAGQGGWPSVSPDGRTVLLRTPTEVTVAGVDGSGRRTVLTFEPVPTYSEWAWLADPVWNEDGSAHVAIALPSGPVEPTTYELWRIEPIGGETEQLGRVVTYWLSAPVWSPNRMRLAYAAPAQGSRENQTLMMAGGDGGGPRSVTTGALAPLAWSPGGTYLAFAQDGQLCIVEDVEGGQPACLASAFDALVYWLDDGHLMFMANAPEDRVLLVQTDVTGAASTVLWEGIAPLTYDLRIPTP